MIKLNPDSLFTIFEQTDTQVYGENTPEEVLDNPYTILGGVVTGVENYYLMDKLYLLRYGKNYQGVRGVIQRRYFNRMYLSLIKLDVNSIEGMLDPGCDILTPHTTTTALNHLLYYYQDNEDYLKCSVIFRYIQTITGE